MTTSLPISQSTGSSRVIRLEPASAVSARFVHCTSFGRPCKSRPPNTPGKQMSNKPQGAVKSYI